MSTLIINLHSYFLIRNLLQIDGSISSWRYIVIVLGWGEIIGQEGVSEPWKDVVDEVIDLRSRPMLHYVPYYYQISTFVHIS